MIGCSPGKSSADDETNQQVWSSSKMYFEFWNSKWKWAISTTLRKTEVFYPNNRYNSAGSSTPPFKFISMCVARDGYVQTSALCLQRPKVYPRSPGTGVTGGCVSSSMDAGNQTQVLWKSSKDFSLLSHLSSPSTVLLNANYQILSVN